jgi:isopentenyl-diphosphate Delta-isomerase
MTKELIVLVDEQNNEIGTAPKLASHNANTPLHRAVSCFAFDPQGRFLMTQRAKSKKSFPGIWTNSCCGHPGPGEGNADTVRRRVQEELGMSVGEIVLALPDFRYRCEMNGLWENEICPVFLTVTHDQPRPNQDEVEAWEWIAWPDFVERTQKRPHSLSYWSVKVTQALLSNETFARFASELSL